MFQSNDAKINYFPVNTLAPKGESVTVFVKKVVGPKSDGFALVDNGKVFVVDIGKAEDTELIDYLLSLREAWIGADPLPADLPARLEVTVIVSHPHPDHIAALPLLFADERFCVIAVYAPTRSQLSFDAEKAPPSLVKYENRLEAACELLAPHGHTAKGVTRVPFGKVYPVETGCEDFTLEIYPSHIDWSEDLPDDNAGYRYILANNPKGYESMVEKGYSNGVMNGNSLWLKASKGAHSVLITGDQRDRDEMLGAMIRHYGEAAFKCTVLKIPHHGEGNYSPHLIGAADPKFTVFTTSIEKAMPDTVKLCEEMDCRNYYTADGNLFFDVSDKEVKAYGIEPRLENDINERTENGASVIPRATNGRPYKQK